MHPLRARSREADQSRAKRLVDRGAAAERGGATSEALQLYRDAIRVAPGFAPAYQSLGLALQASGDLAGAADAYKRAIAADFKYASAHHNLGVVHLHMRNHAKAEVHFRAAQGFGQPFADAWLGLASALEGLGRYGDALDALKHAIAERPDRADAMFNAARICRRTGNIAEAIAHDQRGLQVEPEHYDVHHRLAQDLWNSGRLPEAETSLRQAIALNPEFVEPELDLARLVSAQGRQGEALQLLFGAVARHPASREARAALLERLSAVRVTSVGEGERAVLLSFCRDETASLRPLASTLVELFTHHPGFEDLQRCVDHDQDPFAALGADSKALLADDLFLAALPRLPLLSHSLERVVTHIRRHILERLQAPVALDATDTLAPVLASAIARQCFFSGYPLFVTENERRALGLVREIGRAALEASSIDARDVETAFAAIAMYEYLDEMPHSERLMQVRGWSAAFQTVLQQQIVDHRRERQIASTFQPIGAVEDATSRAVRDQYEAHPYPVWTGLQEVAPSTIEALCQRLRSDSRVPVSPFRILVAGCGTGEHPIQVARTYPQCEVLAVDLSRSSLAYAKRMTEQLGLSNITYRQADILELHELEQRFALIECCGVLHHLADPMIGWQVLVKLLDDAGLMRIGLYSARAREHAGIGAARSFARSFPPTPEGVRQCRRAITELPDEHPAKRVLTCGDFYSLNGCRDLIMHVQEHQFTPRKLGNCLDALQLRFLGLECSRETAQGFRESIPHEASPIDLGAWERFEENHPSTFTSMYLFWCDKRSAREEA